MSRFPLNDDKFSQVRALKLPLGHYAITSSGPLGIREVRQIGDIDMVVDEVLWRVLAGQYGILEEQGIRKIRIGNDIEILGEGSFMAPEVNNPTTMAQITEAEIIEGLPFVKLQHILYFKLEMNRPKDAADIKAIEELLAVDPKA